MLSTRDLRVRYGEVEAVRGVDIDVDPGQITALVGANGAGKTSILMAISGLVPVAGGDILFDGKSIVGTPAHRIAALGITHVLEGRQLFADQSVEDNLRLGAYLSPRRERAKVRERMERELDRFPVLRKRRNQLAGTLSGGEQQMLALSRALMGEPKLLLLDEPSMGLAPQMVETIASTIQDLKSTGSTILLVEQMAAVALRLASRAYVLETGEVALTGAGHELLERTGIRRAYLGHSNRPPPMPGL